MEAPLATGFGLSIFVTVTSAKSGGGGAFTAMVTLLELVEPWLTTTGTALPPGAFAGIVTLIWYSPTEPGASPANVTVAGTPPTVAVGSGDTEEFPPAASPVAGRLLTAPNPVAK